MDKRVENDKSKTNKVLLIILILLFCFTLFITIQYIIKYQESKVITGNEEIIEIKTKDTSASIINNGLIEKKITTESFGEEDEIVVENINSIEMISNEKDHSTIKFDIKYNISKNDFYANVIPSNKSEVLVRFSYSFDMKNWTYINNVISTNTSNISPLIGNNYDIAGLVTNLNVATNFELSATNKREAVIYWRSETIFKNINKIEEVKELNADFIIEYKSSN